MFSPVRRVRTAGVSCRPSWLPGEAVAGRRICVCRLPSHGKVGASRLARRWWKGARRLSRQGPATLPLRAGATRTARSPKATGQRPPLPGAGASRHPGQALPSAARAEMVPGKGSHMSGAALPPEDRLIPLSPASGKKLCGFCSRCVLARTASGARSAWAGTTQFLRVETVPGEPFPHERGHSSTGRSAFPAQPCVGNRDRPVSVCRGGRPCRCSPAPPAPPGRPKRPGSACPSRGAGASRHPGQVLPSVGAG